jgi:hypothetical protein
MACVRMRITLKQAGLALGYLTAEEFDAWVRPEEMTGTRTCLKAYGPCPAASPITVTWCAAKRPL